MATYWKDLTESERADILKQIRIQAIEQEKKDFWGPAYFKDKGEEQDEKRD